MLVPFVDKDGSLFEKQVLDLAVVQLEANGEVHHFVRHMKSFSPDGRNFATMTCYVHAGYGNERLVESMLRGLTPWLMTYAKRTFAQTTGVKYEHRIA